MATESFILGIDEGTTGVGAVLVDLKGRIAAHSDADIALTYPQPGWVEQDASEIWRQTQRVVADVLRGRHARVLAIGITNQRETTVVWDRKTGKPVHPAIVWQCRRTAAECDRFRSEGHADTIAQKTGLVLDPYFSATKLRWILDRLDDTADSSRLAFGTVDTWVLWNLTGGDTHATDPTNASRTMLYNIERRAWDDDLLSLFGVERTLLPSVHPSSGEFGTTRDCGFLPDGIPIYGVVGDQQAALFGQTGFAPGDAKNTYGTGCFLLMNTGETRAHSKNDLLTTLACAENGETVYALEGSVFVAGAAIQWLRDGLRLIGSASETESLAASVPDTGGVVFVPALTGIGAPYWDADVRGAFFGLTRGTTRAHLVRATLEAIAHETADLVEAMEQDSGMRLSTLRVDGGASANDLLMSFQSDILDRMLERPVEIETTVLGAVYLAGLHLGAWSSDDLRTLRRVDRRFSPTMTAPMRTSHRERWKRAVRCARSF
jgi:glycerol kinase